ncbi:MAG TPA: ribbon-helix-helix protein, CopG family [Thermoanaerobaculia bacterium]|nr:ribbon-helix-helix protein, CopG family [Thermoanaerobaculia bacterium]
MKTTLLIDDEVMRRLRRKAAEENTTISELVESALRQMLVRTQQGPTRRRPLPRFSAGKASVDIANREELYRVMEEED